MIWNKLLALEAKSHMGISSEWKGSTQSLFGNHILRVEAPQQYVAPKLPKYDGTCDLLEYECQFEQNMLTISVPLEDLKAIKCKMFTQGLRGPALRWFHNLTSGTINLYHELVLKFQMSFAISVRSAKVDTYLMLIHQGPDELLKKFINRFSIEYVSIPKCTDSITMKVLMQGLVHGFKLKKAIILEPGLSLIRALIMARVYVALEVEGKRHAEEVSRETSAPEDSFLFETNERTTPTARPQRRNETRQFGDRGIRVAATANMAQVRQTGSR
ncbi:hypothetical protein F8388_017222 [Cannabis sativa]|uniref:Retrotransposon gag domain-containing protein n=1 Tax=Cannabis sativa TaxID=3483 RepID=A0A7J6I341_CANSA|nr:hypothetical protein F8388_017222 [Cannabis sativa]KAF4401982.1 hypothetical protein G4B88_017494 [Cannabis sativa]